MLNRKRRLQAPPAWPAALLVPAVTLAFAASLDAPSVGSAQVRALAAAATCPAIARGEDPAGRGPMITASCLPEATLTESNSGSNPGDPSLGTSGIRVQESATLRLEPRLLDAPVSESTGYWVAFYPGDGNWHTTETGDCTGTSSGPASDFFRPGGQSYTDSTLYYDWTWRLSDETPSLASPGFALTAYNSPLRFDSCGNNLIADIPRDTAGPYANLSSSPTCWRASQSGSLVTGLTVTFALSCTFTTPDNTIDEGPYATVSLAGSIVYKEPPCQRRRTGAGYQGLTAMTKAHLAKLYDELDKRNGCYRFVLGYRSKETQQHLHDTWHQIADRQGPNDHRTAAQIDKELGDAGFAQNVPKTASGQPMRDQHGVAHGGPCDPSTKPCRHVAREAADIRWWWRPFGELPFKKTGAPFQRDFLPLVHALAHQAGLCGPPKSDPVHVQLKYKLPGESVAGCHGFD